MVVIRTFTLGKSEFEIRRTEASGNYHFTAHSEGQQFGEGSTVTISTYGDAEKSGVNLNEVVADAFEGCLRSVELSVTRIRPQH